MPFRSEKQRRFLWSQHPDIAKRWAHDYPQKKKLPMYASDSEKKTPQERADESKAASATYTGQTMPTNNCTSDAKSVARGIYEQFCKKSQTKEVKVSLPRTDKPIEAGQNCCHVKETKQINNGGGETQKVNVSSLFQKLSVVLAQPLQQAMENEQAELEARNAELMPMNAGVKRYAMPAAGTPLPMGMQQPAQPAQPAAPQPAQAPTGSTQATLPPVGGGSNPNANPINSYGGISVNGDLNGNAAFGSPGGGKMAAGQNVFAHPISMDHIPETEILDQLEAEIDDTYLKAAIAKYAGSPAWQRSAGKNEEGGLNAKGRASYNKATGGKLKAPVTESNPKGDRAKRQNSFCSRMCGMKKHETGADTKKDPDSRINKSLRKWNCKCSSAYEFGAKMAASSDI